MSIVTPNMGLVLPSPQVTIGPEWASMLNDALMAIDEHTHSSDSGVKVTPSGLNINADVPFGNNSILDVDTIALNSRATDLDFGVGRLYSYLGELYYRDDNGNNVRITIDGVVDAGGDGSIIDLTSPASAIYSSVAKTFTWYEDTDKLARMAMGDILLYRFGETSPNPARIQTPAALGTAITLETPSVSTTLAGEHNIPPVGAIVAYIPGYFADGVNSTFQVVGPGGNDITSVNTYLATQGSNWRVANGDAPNDPDSPIWDSASKYLPNITNDRFLRGGISAGTAADPTYTPTGTFIGASALRADWAAAGSYIPSGTNSGGSATMPGHYHSTDGTGSTINITASGAHGHTSVAGVDTSGVVAGTANRAVLASGAGAFTSGANLVNTAGSNHTHPTANITGLIGKVTSGSNGDANVVMSSSTFFTQPSFSGGTGTLRTTWFSGGTYTPEGTLSMDILSVEPKYITTFYIIRIK